MNRMSEIEIIGNIGWKEASNNAGPLAYRDSEIKIHESS